MQTNKDIVLVRQSWSEAIANRDLLARLFYRNLFHIAPETEPLFKNDLNEQGRKLTATLAFIIDSLDDAPTLLKSAADLAVKHLEFNVVAKQYDYVGQALIRTLNEILGDKFDEETSQAWLSTYGVLADHMIASAYKAS